MSKSKKPWKPPTITKLSANEVPDDVKQLFQSLKGQQEGKKSC